jgi:hypothetical protein
MDRSPMLSRKAVSKMLNVSDKWLRASPKAPPYVVIGPRKHVYDPQAVEAWARARTVVPAERRAA